MLDDTTASQERHDRFVERIVATGEVWGLKGRDGWCVGGSTADGREERNVMPFWSERALAGQCAKDDWSGYQPTVIPLKEFLEEWLPGMDEDKFLVGTNWNAQLVGMELEPAQLNEELGQALQAGSDEE